MTSAIYAVLLLLISILFNFNLSYCYEIAILCPENEKHALLTFKQSLNDSHNLLFSWDAAVDCCKWRGVVCDNSSGHVLELHLLRSRTIGGKITSSLLNLKHLTYLDLSHNIFDGETIPSFIGSFTDLKYLDLSDAGFVGKIPCNIANLSNLQALNFETNHGLYVDSLEWLSGLSKLEYLNMGLVNLRRATDWSKVIGSQLPCLHELHLRGCFLDLTSPLNAVNLTSLTLLDLSGNHDTYQENHTLLPVPQWCFQLNNLLSLDLSYNHLKGPFPTAINATKLRHITLYWNFLINSSIPNWLYFCKDLEFVDLSYTSLQGEISEAIGNLTSLKTLHLDGNELSGKLPREITSLCRLQTLDLFSNELQGEVQNVFGNMSGCFLGSLIGLSLSSNQLSGHLTDVQFGEFKSLEFIDFRYNSLSGAIPTSLGNLSSLVELWLNDNSFMGNLLKSLSQLYNLEELHIESNKLEGIVTESHFSNFSTLIAFSASGNHLTLNVGPNWVPPIQLEILLLGSWSLGAGYPSQLPPWLRTQRNITQLDVSNAGISGTIPTWFFDVQFLNASHNNLHGRIPHMITSQRWDSQYMYMSFNKLRGPLPRIGVSVVHLDLSHNSFTQGLSNLLCHKTNETYHLQLLNLEGNRLSGELPDCSWKRSLNVLKLGNNTMSGSLPNSIGFLSDLEILSLHGNQFSGKLPDTMQNCKNLWKIDLGHNNLDGKIPTWMGTSLVELKLLILRSNKFSGEISPEICHLQYLQILDLSNNQISSKIPRCLSNFTAMATKRDLYLLQSKGSRIFYGDFRSDGYDIYVSESASVVTKGVEREYNTILSLVTILDLSMNNLSGDIPKELTRLVELGSLNLSGNHLKGSIPASIGEMKQLESLDLSQNSLSGQIPEGITLLSSLSRLNLSFNNLTGKIQRSTQLQSLEPSSFIGNDLCGPPLSHCAGDDAQREENEGDDDEASAGIEWLYIFLSLGFAVGFSGVCTALVVKKSWRYAYFGLAESMWNKLYVCFYVSWARLTRTAV